MKPDAMAAALADKIKRVEGLAVQAHALARIGAFALRNATEGLADGLIEQADFACAIELARDLADEAEERGAGSVMRIAAYTLRRQAAGRGPVDFEDLAHLLDAAGSLLAEAAGLKGAWAS